jgi:hypothetical protein
VLTRSANATRESPPLPPVGKRRRSASGYR